MSKSFLAYFLLQESVYAGIYFDTDPQQNPFDGTGKYKKWIENENRNRKWKNVGTIDGFSYDNTPTPILPFTANYFLSFQAVLRNQKKNKWSGNLDFEFHISYF